MRDRARVAHLGEEALARVRVALDGGRQELEGDRLADFQVVCPVDLTHAAAPRKRDDAVAVGEEGAGREAAGFGGMR